MGERDTAGRVALGLGALSLGLGAAQLLAPRRLTRAIGARDTDANARLMRGLGVREIASGAGLLAGRRQWPWAWARVAGDAADLALLARTYAANRAGRRRTAAALAIVAGAGAADIATGVRLQRQQKFAEEVTAAVTIRRPVDEVYAFWRDLENLPQFLTHLESVEDLGGDASRWRVKGPAGQTVEWEAEMTEDRPNERIAWQSLAGAGVQSRGAVTFRKAPRDLGTEVHLAVTYEAPVGGAARALAFASGHSAKQQVNDALRRLKQVLETGEVVLSDAAPLGTDAAGQMRQPPAQPGDRAARAGSGGKAA